MLQRFTRIRHEFGNKDFAKVVFLLVATIAMSLAGYLLLDSPWVPAIAVLGLLVGWLLREKIVDNMETLFRLAPKFSLSTVSLSPPANSSASAARASFSS